MTDTAQTICRRFAINTDEGLHVRAATLFVKTMQPFAAEISVSKGDQTVNGKSVLELFLLTAGRGDELEVCARGDDAAAAMNAADEFFTTVIGTL